MDKLNCYLVEGQIGSITFIDKSTGKKVNGRLLSSLAVHFEKFMAMCKSNRMLFEPNGLFWVQIEGKIKSQTEDEIVINLKGWHLSSASDDQLESLKRKILDSNDSLLKLQLVKNDILLDELVRDGSAQIRAEIAQKGYGLENLINDEDEYVRMRVAQQGYGLETLVNDADNMVRAEVARQGFGLETLVNDTSMRVREAVAQQGYGLETLINDKERNVRLSVAQQGYGLDVLIHDDDKIVRSEAQRIAKTKGI